MPRWTFPIPLDSANGRPLLVQIAHAIAEGVVRGRLRPGDRLPGSRSLAGTLGVHRNTVLAAYRDLAAQGWIETRPARGTFVAADVPDRAPVAASPSLRRARSSSEIGFRLEGDSAPVELGSERGRIELSKGTPDPRLLPVSLLARAHRRVLVRGGGRLVDYGSPYGAEALRRALAEFLAATRGLPRMPGRILVTRGSQMGILLAARALLDSRGGKVAVEALGYRPAWEALRSAGAELVPVPVDRGGIDAEGLARIAARTRLRGIYLTPHHQYPTTVTLDGARRVELLRLAERQGIAVLEDDYDNEFHYEGRPVLPLAASDPAGVVIYVGTFSKVLAPGIRIGYVAAPEPFVHRMARLRLSIDRQGDLAQEEAVADLLEDGEILRHVRRMRRIYGARRAAMRRGIERTLGDSLRPVESSGGMALWAEAAPGIDVDRWAERALAVGVRVLSGREYTFSGESAPCLRLGFAALSEPEIRTALLRLASALGPSGSPRSRL